MRRAAPMWYATVMAILLAAAPAARAQVAGPAAIPQGVGTQDLETQRQAVLAEKDRLTGQIAAHNAQCSQVIDTDTALVASCSSSQSNLIASIQAYKASLAAYETALSAGKSAHRTQQEARLRELDAQIASDAEAIRRLGFARRAEDFAAWDQLATDAKREFEGEVSDAITGAVVDKAQGKILDAFKSFDEASAAKLVARLRAAHPTAGANELYNLIERIGRVADKAAIAADAEEVLKRIDQLQAIAQTPDDRIATAQLAASLMEGLIEDPRLKFLISEVKITSASLYNNASRRVAANEVDRLTTMTEDQLRALNKLQALMVRHVAERAQVAQQLKN